MKKRFSVDVNTDANVNHNTSLSKKDNEIGIETISYRYEGVFFDCIIPLILTKTILVIVGIVNQFILFL